MSGSDEEIRDDSETAAAPEITETPDLDSHLAGEDSETATAPEITETTDQITETTDLDPHLAFSSVPRRRRPATAERDRAREVAEVAATHDIPATVH